MNNHANKMDTFVMPGVIDRFEGAKAVIKTEDRQELIWPKDKLPRDLGEGDLVELAIGAADSLASGRQEKVAREILKQILHTND
jgi:hypothetical protein